MEKLPAVSLHTTNQPLYHNISIRWKMIMGFGPSHPCEVHPDITAQVIIPTAKSVSTGLFKKREQIVKKLEIRRSTVKSDKS